MRALKLFLSLVVLVIALLSGAVFLDLLPSDKATDFAIKAIGLIVILGLATSSIQFLTGKKNEVAKDSGKTGPKFD